MTNNRALLSIIITAAIVGGGVYSWQNDKTILGEETVGEIEVGTEKNVNDEITNETVRIFDCSELEDNWIEFSDVETTLHFCYRKEWGGMNLEETSTGSDYRIGTIWYVGTGTGGVPLVSYSTLDYERIGGGDVPNINFWDVVDIHQSEEQLSTAFTKLEAEFDGTAIVKKVEVNGQPALKVYRKFIIPLTGGQSEMIHYFIPEVTINNSIYNLEIAGVYSLEDDIDTIAASVDF